ncbi:MAG: MFS transporter [Coriobacteriia bacterium]|nr:MFS transporter [Coriobacteriia bacterium]
MTMSKSVSSDPYARKWWVLVAVCMALFMVMLDATVVNVSIQSITKGIGASFSDAEWVLNAYTLVFASMLVTFGRLGDMFGRKRFFVTGLLVFGTGSLMCGLAATPAILIAARVLQALGGAFMVPATLSLTAASFPPHQRGMAMGIWGAVSGAATAAGPLLGGVLTDAFSWRYIFFINLPIVLIAIPFALWAIPESKDNRSHKVDWLGAALSVGVLASLCYGLIEGPKVGWGDARTLSYFGLAAVVLMLFLAWERRAKEPIIDLRLFRNRGFSAGSASGAVLMFGMMGLFFLVPMYLQAQLGYTARATGLAMTPMSAAILVAAPMAGRLSDRIGSRWLMFAGMLTAAVSVFWLSFLSAGDGWQWLILPLVLAGVGMGLVMAPMTSAVMAVAPKGEEGAASGVLSTMRAIGGVFGVAVLGAVFSTAMASNMVKALPSVQALPTAAIPYVTQVVENSSSGMGGTGFDEATLRSQVPTAAMLPLIEGAIRDAANETLPAAMQQPIADAVVAAAATGGSLDGASMMEALTPVMQKMGASGGGMPVDAAAFTAFGTAVGNDIAKNFALMGKSLASAASESFVSALRKAFRLASIVLAIGALLALLVKPGKNEESTLEPIRAAEQ